MRCSTDIDKSGKPRKEAVLLHGFRMNNAKISPHFAFIHSRPLQRLVLFLRQIGHGPLEPRGNGPWCQRSSGENAQFGLSRAVGIPRRVRDFDYSRRVETFEVTGYMSTQTRNRRSVSAG